MTPHPRSQIHYWKCDRAAAFHGTDGRPRDSAAIVAQLGEVLRSRFPAKDIALSPLPSQGNHLLFTADTDEARLLIRIEDGPEHDDYSEVESYILGLVRDIGIPAPRIHTVDASRREVPFAWQVMERIAAPDLNQHQKRGTLNLREIAGKIGAAVAGWQGISPPAFGPFDPASLREDGSLRGFHATYPAYYFQHFERHLRFLVDHRFLAHAEADAIQRGIDFHQPLLRLDQGCLVHKDLALWNILGTETEIAAFIDFDDAISGDPMDDLSLLGCFHDGTVLARALDGYDTVRPLPSDHRRRFWLHLIRNMLVKAVIRVGAGYFDRTDRFFLIGAGGTGSDLAAFTHARLIAALRGLNEDRDIRTL